MKFTEYEQTVITELEKRAGDVLYFEDIAPYFISKSLLQISTYTQTAYIQLGDNMQASLSEYFQLVVFIKKLEENGSCFSIPYTPLEDNLTLTGNNEFAEYQQHTIADGDLLIQLFHFASKKYIVALQSQAEEPEKPSALRSNLLIPSFILLLLFLFIGGIGYQAYVDNNTLKLNQSAIKAQILQQSKAIDKLSQESYRRERRQDKIVTKLTQDVKSIIVDLKNQSKTLRNINYWNRKQANQIQRLIEISALDSIE